MPIADFHQSNWHMFHIVLPDRITRATFMQRMLDLNIGVGFHYAAIHLFTLYRRRGFKEGMFPVAERVCRQIVTLPPFPRHGQRRCRTSSRWGEVDLGREK